jgi:hypothetical protein
MSENVELVHPWENTEALGVTTGKHIKDSYLYGNTWIITAHKTEHIKPEDCVEHDIKWLTEKDTLSIVVLSKKSWKPVWRRVASRSAIVGNNLVVGQDDTFFNVLLNINGTFQKLWLSEKALGMFAWTEKDIEKVQGNQANGDLPGT